MVVGNTGGTGGAKNISTASQIVGSSKIGDQKSGLDKLKDLGTKANAAIDGNPELALEGAILSAIKL